MAEDIPEEVVSQVGTVIILGEIIIRIEIEKKGGLGHGQDQEKEELKLDQGQVLDQDQT